MKIIAGVDEAGRGAWAGNVVAAAVILPSNYDLPGLTDSKKLSSKKRDYLYDGIYEQALSVSYGEQTPEEIDELNIHQATLTAMTLAINGLTFLADEVWIDGAFVPKGLGVSAKAIIGGDGLEPAIAAASIIAKVTRDRQLVDLDKKYPAYGFARHKGYGTVLHRNALLTHGVLPIHRKSYAPVAQCLK
ncbi:ribonuclease HII [Suttonella ornithocola]|uniref:Ribonuclease HII n=1 Tax=Suttonella ornithocola TaxID=279832 RepID=A0A380MX25_9GAMM|nr:ribonuclease HII [Suttonella ornithocola]SUO97109.1 Ribonuclease HII [Suttonella ornithocola]